MSDPKSNRASIPDWQKPKTTTPTSTSTPSPSSDDDDTSRSALLEQATKFLQDDSIRDAPIDRKITFLESKGLRNDEIESLLGVSRNTEASSAEQQKTASPDSTTSTPETRSEEPSTTATSPSTSSSSTTPSTNNTRRTSSPRDVPPIITYPEFLVQEAKPPPLVTLRSILYTIYGAAGLGASFYGASEYLVKPMLANLTSARHDLASTATANLTKLNEKLEQNVSVIPPQLTARKTDGAEDVPEEEDVESITSDPTELFHRDVATQTSDVGEKAAAAAAAGEDAALSDPSAAVNNHLSRMKVITSHLREFADSEKESATLDDSLRTSLNEVHHYLDGLIYSKPGYGPVTGYGVYSSPGMDNGSSTGVGKGEEDAISSFRSEIRGVKGALLSAKNFPTSRGGSRIGGGSYGR